MHCHGPDGAAGKVKAQGTGQHVEGSLGGAVGVDATTCSVRSIDKCNFQYRTRKCTSAMIVVDGPQNAGHVDYERLLLVVLPLLCCTSQVW